MATFIPGSVCRDDENRLLYETVDNDGRIITHVLNNDDASNYYEYMPTTPNMGVLTLRHPRPCNCTVGFSISTTCEPDDVDYRVAWHLFRNW